jgi:hypothetical protein
MRKTKFRINTFYGHRYVAITPDSDPSDVETVFSCGNCHSLALAIHKMTSWPLYGIYHPINDNVANHVFVKTPTGNFVDIQGEQTPEEFSRKWVGTIQPITRKQISDWVRARRNNQIGYIPPRTKAAQPYAEKVLEKVKSIEVNA